MAFKVIGREEVRSERVSILLGPQRLQKFQEKCLTTGISMNEAMNQLILGWIGGASPRGSFKADDPVQIMPSLEDVSLPETEDVSLNDVFSDNSSPIRGYDFLMKNVIGEETDESVLEAIKFCGPNKEDETDERPTTAELEEDNYGP